MKEYMTSYMQLLRAGFFKESYKFLLIVLIGIIIFGSKIGADIEIIIFIFLSMGIFLDLDEKKYTLATSLPMKIKTRIKMLYINTYAICFLGGTITQFASLIRGETRPVVTTLIIILISTIGCNGYYLIFASNEFKEDPQERVGEMMGFAFILTIVGIILLGIHFITKEDIISSIMKEYSVWVQISFVAVLGILALIVSRGSYKRVVETTCNID